MRMLFVLATAVLTVVMSAALGSHTAVAQDMSFFITSAGPGDGAKLGGLSGADQHCQILADNVGAGGLSWRAYLSAAAAGGQTAVNARDRIGAGPWYNAKAVMVARDVDDLHGPNNKLSKENSLTEAGAVRPRPPGQGGYGPPPPPVRDRLPPGRRRDRRHGDGLHRPCVPGRSRDRPGRHGSGHALAGRRLAPAPRRRPLHG